MAAVQRLCTSAMLLEHGRLVRAGDVRSTVAAYLGGEARGGFAAAARTGDAQILSADLEDLDGRPLDSPSCTEPIVCRIRFTLPRPLAGNALGIGVLAVRREPRCSRRTTSDAGLRARPGPGEFDACVTIPRRYAACRRLPPRACLWNAGAILDLQEPALSFSVDTGASLLYAENAMRKGYVHVDCRWSVTHVDVARGDVHVTIVERAIRRAERAAGYDTRDLHQPDAARDPRWLTFCRAVEYINYEAVAGDIVEFGVFTGISLMLLARAQSYDPRGMGRRVAGFDLFRGLPGSDEPHARWQPGDCASNHSWHPLLNIGDPVTPDVTRRLFEACGFPAPMLHVGSFTETLPAAFPAVAFHGRARAL